MKKYLLLLIVIAFTYGGCGGSSGSSQGDSQAENTTPIVSAPFDSNGDGVPDVFGYSLNLPANAAAYDVPYLNYIASSDADEDGSFTVRINLTQGHEYILKYSHSSRPLTESYLDFTIITPDDKELVFDFGFEEESADEPIPSDQAAESSILVSTDELSEPPEEFLDGTDTGIREYVTVKAGIDIIPPENPCVISYAFTAPQTGIYEFTFREMEYSPVSYDLPYELRIYSADDDSVLKIGNITLTERELLDLQRVLLSYADEFNDDGLPVSFRPEFDSEDVYMNMLQGFFEDSESISAAADNGASIKPVVYGVPYDVEFSGGRGFYATSGIASLSETAFVNFVMPTPKDGAYLPVVRLFETDEIITEEEHNRELELLDMSTFAMIKNALGERVQTAMNVRLAQISKNVVINYEVIEDQPRMVNVNDLQFSADALDLLKRYTDFREEYGDYFVAGYRWGMRFRAVISVTSNNRSALDRVCSLIKTMASKAGRRSGYSSEVEDINSLAKQYYIDISVEEMTVDGKGPRKIDRVSASSLGTVADALVNFSRQLNSSTKDDYVPLIACFQRYREIPAAKDSIPALLPIPQSHFNAILEMNKMMFRARCSYNALMSIPLTHLVDGSTKRNEWSKEFNDLMNTTKNQLNYICDRESRANDYKSKFERLHEKYSALCERYVFYRRLVDEQKSQSSGFSNSDSDREEKISGGFYTYSQSSAVMSDYGKYADKLHTNLVCKEKPKILSTWTWKVEGDQYGTNWRYVWFEVRCRNTNKSKGEDQAYPTVGSKKVKWYFEGGCWRGVEWYFKNKIIRMAPNDYPFVGLKD